MGAEGLTYNERRGQGYGTVKERLGKVCRPGKFARKRRTCVGMLDAVHPLQCISSQEYICRAKVRVENEMQGISLRLFCRMLWATFLTVDSP